MLNIFGLFSVLLYLVAVVFHQLEDKSSVHERQQVVEEESQTDVDFLCLLYLLKRQQSTNSNQQAVLGLSRQASSCASWAFDTTEAETETETNIISTSSSVVWRTLTTCTLRLQLLLHNPGEQRVHRCSVLGKRHTGLVEMMMSLIYCRHSHILYLMLFDKDGPNLSSNHRDDGGDVIFKSVREAASSRNVVLVKLRHMLSHAFHLLIKTNTHTHNKYKS